MKDTNSQITRLIPIAFRWPVKQVGENQVQVMIPMDGNLPLLNPEAVGYFKLSEREAAEAEEAALREIVIIR